MKFYVETLQDSIEDRLEAIERTKEKIKKVNAPTIQAETMILWEVAELVEASVGGYCHVYWQGNNGIGCMISPIEVDAYQELLDNIDEIFNANNYTQDLEYTQASYISGQEFRFQHPDKINGLFVQFNSSECTTENTGKMIPETRNTCNLIKG